MSDTDRCARCGGDCPMTSCPVCGGCENTGTQPCPGCQPEAADRMMPPCDYDDPDDCARCYGTGEYVPEQLLPVRRVAVLHAAVHAGSASPPARARSTSR